MSRIGVLVILSVIVPTPAAATPISVGSFSFAAGEAAFADDAFLVSGSGVRFNCTAGGTAASSFGEALSGSDVTQCVNVAGGGDGIVEVRFTDNSIVNGAGVDLVIFEVSGPQAPGTPDPKERFEAGVFDGSAYSPFVAFDPVATGFGTPDPTLDIFAVEIDLSAFGIEAGARVDRVRLHLFDNGLGSKGADIAALGALNSGAAIPEPSSALLLAGGLLLLAWRRGGHRKSPRPAHLPRRSASCARRLRMRVEDIGAGPCPGQGDRSWTQMVRKVL